MVSSKKDDEVTQSARFGSTGPLVEKLQAALNANGFDLGVPDGDFGRSTLEALMVYQARQGNGADGVLGPNTAASLGIELPTLAGKMPIGATEASAPSPTNGTDILQGDEELTARPPLNLVEAASVGRDADGPLVVEVSVDADSNWTGRVADGQPFYIGRSVNWEGFKGIFQPADRLDRIPGGKYVAADWAAELGNAKAPWAWFLLPTIMAESGGYFGRINTYDGAGMTFGMIQFASHTPKDNLILLFRRLLAMPDARRWFPDLALDAGKVAQKTAEGLVSLETDVDGRLKRFMAYLNPDSRTVEKVEALSAARLIAWAAGSTAIKRAQVDVAIERLSYKVDRLRTKYEVDLAEYPIYCAIWVADILHHGRSKYTAIRDAFNGSNPEARLAKIGSASWGDRLAVVSAEIDRLKGGRQLDGMSWGDGPFVLTE